MSGPREPLISAQPPDHESHGGVSSPPANYARPAGCGPPKYETFQDRNSQTTSETTSIMSLSFEDITVRRGFVRKVFGILTLQLVFTFSTVCVFTFSSGVKAVVQNNIWIFLSSVLLFIVVATTLIILVFLSSMRHHPWNLVGLAIITLSVSYMVGTVASYFDTTSVVIALAVTLVVSFSIIVFSAQTRYDFTIYYGVLLILAVDVVMFGLMCTFYYSHVASIAYGCLGALVCSLFLMIDCQLMMGIMSDRLSPEEYVSAALLLYLDVILIFLYVLQFQQK